MMTTMQSDINHMISPFQFCRGILAINGDIVKVRSSRASVGEMAIIESAGQEFSLSQVIEVDRDMVSLQVLSGALGLSSDARVRFLRHEFVIPASNNVLGRVFRGNGAVIDNGPRLDLEPTVPLHTATVNPLKRIMPGKMIRTDIPMIDIFNCLVESQKIPIFSTPGESYNELLARIAFQADADVIVFCGIGLIFDDFLFFRQALEEKGVVHRSVMFLNLASDPVVERMIVLDAALAVAEMFATRQNKRTLVLVTDMTSYADAMKEIGIMMERIPSNRGYMGDLYSQLAQRYEKACDFSGAGSVTILAVTTMPGNDITHPVPDNTGYITEGQLCLVNGMIDPFASLSRLKQHVIGSSTREDHSQVMNAMIRLYAKAQESRKKQSLAFDLTDVDQRLIRFGGLFEQQLMHSSISLSLEKALDRCWQIMAQCFRVDELMIKKALTDKYFSSQDPDMSVQAGIAC